VILHAYPLPHAWGGRGRLHVGCGRCPQHVDDGEMGRLLEVLGRENERGVQEPNDVGAGNKLEPQLAIHWAETDAEQLAGHIRLVPPARHKSGAVGAPLQGRAVHV